MKTKLMIILFLTILHIAYLYDRVRFVVYISSLRKTDSESSFNFTPNNWWRGRDVMNLPIVDPSTQRLDPPPHFPNITSKICPSTIDSNLIESKGGHQVLQKIKRGMQKSQHILNSNAKRTKVLCMVYTVDTPSNTRNLKAIAETWGRKCDGFIASSNVTNHSLGSIHLTHEGDETYDNIWAKVISTWMYAYRNYRQEFDYFYICGDDTYVVMENLYAFLISDDMMKLQEGYRDAIYNATHGNSISIYTHELRPRPLILAAPMMYKRKPVINGGTGYILNRAALNLFGQNIMNPREEQYTNVTSSMEDVFMGQFFLRHGVSVSVTNDFANGGGRRFAGTADNSFSYTPTSDSSKPLMLQKRYGLPMMYGADSISEQQIAFHLKDDWKRKQKFGFHVSDLMYRYHAVLYDLCASTSVSK